MRLLDDKALTVIFANVEDILLANTTFLSSLEQRQKACRLYIDVIGDILQENMTAMSVYTVRQVHLSFGISYRNYPNAELTVRIHGRRTV